MKIIITIETSPDHIPTKENVKRLIKLLSFHMEEGKCPELIGNPSLLAPGLTAHITHSISVKKE